MFTKNTNYIVLILLFFTTTSCVQKKLAPIFLKGDNKHYKKFKSSKTNISSNQINVGSGDNLYHISKKYNILVRDLIEVNNLEPPYILRVGSTLNLPDTKYHIIKEGENLHKISRNYDMNLSDIISLNNLQKPYTIIAGSKLKISGASFNKKLSSNVQSRNLSSAKSITKDSKTAKIDYKNNKFIWPVKGKIISTFGQKAGGLYNDGINIKANELEPVKAIEDGLVAYVGNELRGYGNLVIIKHSGGWISAYAHLKNSKVTISSKIKQGDIIGLVGSTGNVDFAQLYFGIRKGREALNPESYLSVPNN